MITSRPDESDKMKQEIDFDLYVEITGFSEPQVKEYIKKYFKDNEHMKNDVLDHITKNDNLVSFAHVPVLCFLMCSYFEYILNEAKNTDALPVKTSDLYFEVVNIFVRKHHKKKKLSLEDTLDKLSLLAAQLLLEKRFLFVKETLQTFSSQEIESLVASGLLHCGPPFRTSFSSEPTKHFCFTHLTLQEYLAARWFVKRREIPPESVSTEVLQFMSGILSKEKDNNFMGFFLVQVSEHMDYGVEAFNREGTRGVLLMAKCLAEYKDHEFATSLVKKSYREFCGVNGKISLRGLTDVDCIAVSFLLDVFSAVNAEDESAGAGVVSLCQTLQTATCKVTTLDLRENVITDAGVLSLCQALQAPTCKVTTLDLSHNQITSAGVVSLCQALQTPTSKVTTLDLSWNWITDAGVVSLCQALQTPTCKVITLTLSDNQITDAGVASVCQALQTPTCKVTTLDLSHNQITDAGVASLCQALQTPTCKVTALHLSRNYITDACVVSLCQALQTTTCKVTTLDLSHNQITDAGVDSLFQTLQAATCKVTTLDLRYNQITDSPMMMTLFCSKTNIQ